MKYAAGKIKQKFRQVNWIVIAVVLILTYGFVMTNPSIGIDDENFSYFYKNNGMMVSGRWGYWLLEKIFDTYTYLPVWREMLAIVCLVAAAVFVVCICEHVLEYELDTCSSTIIVSLIVSYPLVAKMFVYMNNCLETTGGILFATLAAYVLYCGEHRKRDFVFAVIFLLIGCSQIENTLITFYVEICLFSYLKKEKDNLWKDILFPVVLSLLTVVLSQGIGRLLAWTTGTPYSNYGMGIYAKWGNVHTPSDLIGVAASIKNNYGYWFSRYFSVKLFTAAACFWLIVAVVRLIHKQVLKCLYAVGVVVASLAMYIITANGALPIRIFTVYFVAVTGAVVCIFDYLHRQKMDEKGSQSKRWLNVCRGVLIVGCVISVFYATKESNLHFRDDYKRYQRDVSVAQTVNYDLQKLVGVTPDVPVIFLGQPEGYGDLDPRGEFALESIYYDNQQGQSIRIHRFFDMLGYKYPDVMDEEVTPENIQERKEHPLIVQAREQSQGMPVYPYDGYIKVLPDKIIIKLGEVQ